MDLPLFFLPLLEFFALNHRKCPKMFDDFRKLPMLCEDCERPGLFLYAFYRQGLEGSIVDRIILFLEIESTITTVLNYSRKWPRFTLTPPSPYLLPAVVYLIISKQFHK